MYMYLGFKFQNTSIGIPYLKAAGSQISSISFENVIHLSVTTSVPSSQRISSLSPPIRPAGGVS